MRQSGHEHFSGSLVIPVINELGEVTEVYGRKIISNLRPGTPNHLYLPGPHRGVFNIEGLTGGTVILCESLIDALSFYCQGFYNVTSTYGINGFTQAHRDVFASNKVTKCLIAYDNDKAGNSAAEDLSKLLLESGIEALRVVLPLGADINEVVVGSSSPKDDLLKFINQARWIGKGESKSPPSNPSLADTPLPSTPLADTPSLAANEEPLHLEPISPTPKSHDEMTLDLNERRYRIRNIGKPTPGSLKVTVMVNNGDRFFVDVVDLYLARARTSFSDACGKELHVEQPLISTDLGKVLLSVEEAQAASQKKPEVAPLDERTKERAMHYLNPLI
jgi:DNA primase